MIPFALPGPDRPPSATSGLNGLISLLESIAFRYGLIYLNSQCPQ